MCEMCLPVITYKMALLKERFIENPDGLAPVVFTFMNG